MVQYISQNLSEKDDLKSICGWKCDAKVIDHVRFVVILKTGWIKALIENILLSMFPLSQI